MQQSAETHSMITYSSKQSLYASSAFAWPWKKQHCRFARLNRRITRVKGPKANNRLKLMNALVKMKNLKLYLENQCITEENKKLRKKAILLHKEKLTLLAQLQNKVSNHK